MSLFLGHTVERQHIQALVDCKLDAPNLIELFEKAFEDVKDSMITADEVQRLYQLQGQAIVLRDFLEAVKASQEIKTRMENRK